MSSDRPARRIRSGHAMLTAHGEPWVWLTAASLAIAIARSSSAGAGPSWESLGASPCWRSQGIGARPSAGAWGGSRRGQSCSRSRCRSPRAAQSP